MATYFSPDGNPEVWNTKPENYYTEGEWYELNPLPEPEIYEDILTSIPDLGSRIDAVEDIILALLKGEIHV